MKSARRLYQVREPKGAEDGSWTIAGAATRKQGGWAGMASAEQQRDRCGTHCLAEPLCWPPALLTPFC